MTTFYICNGGKDSNDGLSWETAKRTFEACNAKVGDEIILIGDYVNPSLEKVTAEFLGDKTVLRKRP